jgi:hypothetical protein
VEVFAPKAVKMYNKYMGGVDRHDQLIAEATVNPNMDWNWNTTYGGQNNNATQETTDDTILDDSLALPRYTFPTKTCMPIHMKNLQIPLSTKIKVCQICHYEMRPYRWKSVVLCSKHGVCLCSDNRPAREDSKHKLVKKDGSDVTDWTWMDRTNQSCRSKFHNFYQPQGLFNNHFHVDVQAKKCKFAQFKYSSDLYQKKYNALGIEIQCRRGKNKGVGKIDWNDHLTRENDDSYSESEIEQSDSSN